MTQALNSKICVVYEPWGKNRSFTSVDKFLAYCQIQNNQTCKSLVKQGICHSYKDAKTVVAEWNKAPFWGRDKFRFAKSVNANLVEVLGKQVFIGNPNHYFTYTFDDCFEALREGEKAAQLATHLKICLESASREEIDKLIEEFDKI